MTTEQKAMTSIATSLHHDHDYKETRVENYLKVHSESVGEDRETIKKLVLRLSDVEREHALTVGVFLDEKSKGHLMCRCSGKRLKDCPQIPGGSRCPHPIEKGTNKGLYKKKSTCPICSPEKFCEHGKRRDNCEKCNYKKRSQMVTLKRKDIQKTIVKKTTIEKTKTTKNIHNTSKDGKKDDNMTFSCSKGVRREKRNFKPFNVKKNLHVTVKENIPFGGKEMEDINMVNNDVMLCEKDEFLTITVEKYSFSSEVLVPDEISCDDLPDLLSHDDIDFEDFGF